MGPRGGRGAHRHLERGTLRPLGREGRGWHTAETIPVQHALDASARAAPRCAFLYQYLQCGTRSLCETLRRRTVQSMRDNVTRHFRHGVMHFSPDVFVRTNSELVGSEFRCEITCMNWPITRQDCLEWPLSTPYTWRSPSPNFLGGNTHARQP